MPLNSTVQTLHHVQYCALFSMKTGEPIIAVTMDASVQKMAESVLKGLAEEGNLSHGTRKDVCKGWNATLHLATQEQDGFAVFTGAHYPKGPALQMSTILLNKLGNAIDDFEILKECKIDSELASNAFSMIMQVQECQVYDSDAAVMVGKMAEGPQGGGDHQELWLEDDEDATHDSEDEDELVQHSDQPDPSSQGQFALRHRSIISSSKECLIEDEDEELTAPLLESQGLSGQIDGMRSQMRRSSKELKQQAIFDMLKQQEIERIRGQLRFYNYTIKILIVLIAIFLVVAAMLIPKLLKNL